MPTKITSPLVDEMTNKRLNLVLDKMSTKMRCLIK